MKYEGMAKGKNMNPIKPVNKSPILGKSLTAKGSLDKTIKPNLKNMGKSIKPTIKSKPIK